MRRRDEEPVQAPYLVDLDRQAREEETDVAVAALTSALEPILMVGVGGMVGVVLIAMYLPIFSLAGNIKAD